VGLQGYMCSESFAGSAAFHTFFTLVVWGVGGSLIRSRVGVGWLRLVLMGADSAGAQGVLVGRGGHLVCECSDSYELR
jgi:hypothetical protein